MAGQSISIINFVDHYFNYEIPCTVKTVRQSTLQAHYQAWDHTKGTLITLGFTLYPALGSTLYPFLTCIVYNDALQCNPQIWARSEVIREERTGCGDVRWATLQLYSVPVWGKSYWKQRPRHLKATELHDPSKRIDHRIHFFNRIDCRIHFFLTGSTAGSTFF